MTLMKHHPLHAVATAARERTGLGPSVKRWSIGMVHTAQSTCPMVLASSSVNKTGWVALPRELIPTAREQRYKEFVTDGDRQLSW